MSVSTVIALVAVLAAIGALGWSWTLSRKLAAALDRSSELEKLAEAGDIVALGEHVGARLDALESADTNRQADDAALSARLEQAIRHVGLVRYDAFPNAAGEQSFSLAMLDDTGAGFVMTSIYGRGEYRMYAKPVSDGGSGYSLTEEESAAIASATRHGEER